jgi:Stress responsive A/B Barrel Domain
VIAHVVLFRPRANLTPEERAGLAAALRHALENIPLITRARIGRRCRIERAYEDRMREDFPYVAILEFEAQADLVAYLEHPAHEALGRRIFDASEGVLVYDFETIDPVKELGDCVIW